MVSIILPNLNTSIEFLCHRIKSIKEQIHTEWECIVIDGFSTNGSYEYLLRESKTDKRFVCYQKPRFGIYDAWNKGIALAKGEYVYIATSDDLFELSFLSIMTQALDINTDCDIAHCCLNIIDKNNDLTKDQWHEWDKVKFYGEMIIKYHKRIAPYDAIIHFGWSTVYTSCVQLLIRTKLFKKIGPFSTKFGSIADFEWGLRASLITNTIHVPLYLASWRRHEDQATNVSFLNSPQFYNSLINMSANAFQLMKYKSELTEADRLLLVRNYLLLQFTLSSKRQKVGFLCQNLLKYPTFIFKILINKLFGIPFMTTENFLRGQLLKKNLNEKIIPI